MTQVSHRPVKCQSRLWSHRGTKVNRSHRGDRPLDAFRFFLNRDPNRDKKLCDPTSNGTDQYQNGSSNLLTPYREQPRSTRIVVAYPRPAFSATNRTNYAPTSFDQSFVLMYWYICMYVCMHVCMYACMYVCIFIKLHITAQSGPVIRVILCHSH